MKGKITIVLFSLVLVFGMLAASCDDGAFTAQDDKDASTYFAYKSFPSGLPMLNAKKLPIPMKSADVYKALQEKIVYSTNDGETWSAPVEAKALGKVAVKPEYISDDDKAVATKWAGLQIIVRNPAIPKEDSDGYVELPADED